MHTHTHASVNGGGGGGGGPLEMQRGGQLSRLHSICMGGGGRLMREGERQPGCLRPGKK